MQNDKAKDGKQRDSFKDGFDFLRSGNTNFHMGVMKVSINLDGESKPTQHQQPGVANDGRIKLPQRLPRLPIFTINLVE